MLLQAASRVALRGVRRGGVSLCALGARAQPSTAAAFAPQRRWQTGSAGGQEDGKPKKVTTRQWLMLILLLGACFTGLTMVFRGILSMLGWKPAPQLITEELSAMEDDVKAIEREINIIRTSVNKVALMYPKTEPLSEAEEAGK